jgi:hypothetical protein
MDRLKIGPQVANLPHNFNTGFSWILVGTHGMRREMPWMRALFRRYGLMTGSGCWNLFILAS